MQTHNHLDTAKWEMVKTSCFVSTRVIIKSLFGILKKIVNSIQNGQFCNRRRWCWVIPGYMSARSRQLGRCGMLSWGPGSGAMIMTSVSVA